MSNSGTLTSATTIFLLSAMAYAQVPSRTEFRVNSYTTDRQDTAAVAARSEGSFVVVWSSRGSFGSDDWWSSIQGQLYASDGHAVGTQFQVNSYTMSYQRRPAVAIGTAGGFVVVWESVGSFGSDISGSSIQGQRLTSAGLALGPQFQVNSYTPNDQVSPDVEISSSDGFVVSWTSTGSVGDDSHGSSVQAQRFNSGGSANGTQFQVNSYTTSNQASSAVVVAPNGDFVVFWESIGPNVGGSNWNVEGKRYSSNGNVLGGQFRVNSFSSVSQRRPDASIDNQGNMAVVWQSWGSDNGDDSWWSVQGKRYSSDGSVLGSEFLVNSYTTALQWFPSVAAGPAGDFVVAWESEGSDDSDHSDLSIQAQRFSSDGSPIGDQFQANTYVPNDQVDPVVAVDGMGDFVILWTSDGSSNGDPSLTSIQGQRYRVCADHPTETCVIFDDGFESGDTSSWSITNP